MTVITIPNPLTSDRDTLGEALHKALDSVGQYNLAAECDCLVRSVRDIAYGWEAVMRITRGTDIHFRFDDAA